MKSWSIDERMKEKLLEYFYDDINITEYRKRDNLNYGDKFSDNYSNNCL